MTMRQFGFTSIAVSACLASYASLALADLDPIVIKGSKFFLKSTGAQFFIKGVAYQQNFDGNGTVSTTNSFTDPLADVASCQRDIPLLKALGTNTIRTYAIDPTKDHSECMKLLQAAGIYVISDLSEPKLSINREQPQWTTELYARYANVITELSQYSNVIGFFAGNEVANAANNTQATPFVKAAVRDMKAYIKRMKYRPMGVGYATSDDAEIRDSIADYFNCGKDEESVDFWGYNIYSWCGKSSYQTSGYKDRTASFANYSVPVFFAEYGCNQPSPRIFDEVQALYGNQMSPVWSGGIVYEYFQEENDFGIVSVSDGTASKLSDYTALSKQLAKVSPTSTNSAVYAPSNTQARACPTTGDSWNASSTLPPIPNAELCSCVVNTLTCVAKSGLSDKAIGSLFGTIFELDPSAFVGINADGSSGTYGGLSMCSGQEQLSWVMNTYYFHQNNQNRASACDFKGQATTQSAAVPPASCKPLLSQLGAAGTGTVTSVPTGTGSFSGGSGSGSGSGSGGSGASGSGSSASATATKKPSGAESLRASSFDFGSLQLGLYVVAAMMSGAGMILL